MRCCSVTTLLSLCSVGAYLHLVCCLSKGLASIFKGLASIIKDLHGILQHTLLHLSCLLGNVTCMQVYLSCPDYVTLGVMHKEILTTDVCMCRSMQANVGACMHTCT